VAQIVLSDATALIYLAQIPEGLSEGVFGRVTITSVVKEEVLPGKNAPGESEIREAINSGLIKVIADRWTTPVFPWLDEGEASTLRAAVNLADAGNQCLVLIDEKEGRAVAKELASSVIAVSGTVATIGRAKELGLIQSASIVFQQLTEKGFRVADDVIQKLLQDIGEARPSIGPKKPGRKSRGRGR
jgi:predicted nucleic acid-binding protein